jgi:hypothetical protein
MAEQQTEEFELLGGGFEIFYRRRKEGKNFLDRSTALRRHFVLVTTSAAEAARRNSE